MRVSFILSFVYAFVFCEMQPPPGVCDISRQKLEMTSDPKARHPNRSERSRPHVLRTERIGYCILVANTRAQLPHRHSRPPHRMPRVIKIYSLESKNKFCLVPRSSSFRSCLCSSRLTVARRCLCLLLSLLLSSTRFARLQSHTL